MTRGGKRGRPVTQAPTERKLTVRLDAEQDRLLTALELVWRCSAAEALRRAIRETAERTVDESEPKPRKGPSAVVA